MSAVRRALVLLCLAGAAAGEESVADLVARLTAPATPWAERRAAGDALCAAETGEVLERLLPHIRKELPEGVYWFASGLRDDPDRLRTHPPVVQIYATVHYVWQRHTEGAPSVETGELLAGLLARARTPDARWILLTTLERHWHASAGATCVALLAEKDAPASVRLSAARCLMVHDGKAHHDALLAQADAAEGEERSAWLELLTDERHKAEAGIDPRVVHFGFAVLLEECERRPDYVHTAYFLALRLGGYLGRSFQPDQEEYQGEHGLDERFFSDTVANARAWWVRNGKRFSR